MGVLRGVREVVRGRVYVWVVVVVVVVVVVLVLVLGQCHRRHLRLSCWRPGAWLVL